VLSVEDWAEIRRLARAEGLSVKAIVRRMGISRNAVRRALASQWPPKYSRPARGSVFDAVEPRVCELLRLDPRVPATVIAERIGWEHSVRLLRMRVRELRPLFLPADPASRTTYDPGELAQCDLWFPPVDLALGAGQVGRPPVLVMVSGYSRWIEAVLLPSRQGPDLLAGHWRLLDRLGAVPRVLVWDNESAVGTWRCGRPQLRESFAAFAGTLGIGILQCRPRDPEAKGLVERVNRYFETSFLPGRTFIDYQDFEWQLTDWLARANTRKHRAIGCRPAERIEADRAAMLPLTPVPSWTSLSAGIAGWSLTTRLPRDHYVRLASNDYSVHPSAVGRLVHVTADLHTVSVTCDGPTGREVVAEHERCWARHQTLTDPAHRAAADRMRMAHRALTKSPAPPTRAAATTVEVTTRPLTHYDVVLADLHANGRQIDLTTPLTPAEAGQVTS
jgi:transposase